MPALTDGRARDHQTLGPPWARSEFFELMGQMVAVSAPRLFAIVEEYGEAIDARIAAWGIAFADRVEIATTEGATLKLAEPETAVAFFGRSPDVTAHLIWADTATLPQTDGAAPTKGWCLWHGPLPPGHPCCPYCPIRISSLGNTNDDGRS